MPMLADGRPRRVIKLSLLKSYSFTVTLRAASSPIGPKTFTRLLAFAPVMFTKEFSEGAI
jgi:hypothetical protein